MSENKQEDIKKKTMKYGNDDLYESPIDTHIFHQYSHIGCWLFRKVLEGF